MVPTIADVSSAETPKQTKEKSVLSFLLKESVLRIIAITAMLH
jgi:hypothetical protein